MREWGYHISPPAGWPICECSSSSITASKDLGLRGGCCLSWHWLVCWAMGQPIKLACLGFRTGLLFAVSHSLQAHAYIDRHCNISLCVQISHFSGVFLCHTHISQLNLPFSSSFLLLRIHFAYYFWSNTNSKKPKYLGRMKSYGLIVLYCVNMLFSTVVFQTPCFAAK